MNYCQKLIKLQSLKLRKLPSELCNILNVDQDSPFNDMIKRVSDEESFGVITDSSMKNDSEKLETTWNTEPIQGDWWRTK